MKVRDIDRQSPMLKHMNQRVVSAQAGQSVVEATPTETFYNPMGRIHGGFTAALIDTALGVAVHTKVPEGTQFGTVDLNVKYVRKITADTGVLTARGTVLHAGRTMLTVEARVEDAAGTLYAHGSGTFLVYPKQ